MVKKVFGGLLLVAAIGLWTWSLIYTLAEGSLGSMIIPTVIFGLLAYGGAKMLRTGKA